MSPRPLALGLALAAALTAAGCAHAPAPMRVPAPMLAARPLVLMLPLANLSGRTEQSDIVSRVFYSELTRTGACEVVDFGEAQRLVEALRMRDPGSPTAAQLAALRDSTGARLVLAGTVLEAGNVRAPEGDVPTVGVALRLIDTGTLRAGWADSRFATGQDHETVFGWGRESSLSRLTTRLATEMFESFRNPAAAADTARGDRR